MNGRRAVSVWQSAFAALIVILSWNLSLAGLDSVPSIQTEYVPPGFVVPWDIGKKDSCVSQEFRVTEYRYYSFQIAFRRADNSMESGRELLKFTGDGKAVMVTRETADTAEPSIYSGTTPEDLHKLNEGILRGDYVPRMERSGVMIPVHLKVEVLQDHRSSGVQFDQVVKTWNIEGSSPDGIVRMITTVKLRPGTYRVSATTVQGTSGLPPNVATLLRVSYRPETREFQPNE
jgi:uncharacterized protein DUF5625